MANPVEGPSGHGADAVRPPVAIAGVDANGKIRHLLLTATGALSLAASSVSIGEVQLLGADGLTLGVVTGTGALKVDGSAVTQPVSLAAETTKVIGTVNQGTSPWVTTANIGTTNGLALDATLTGGNQQVQGNIASGAADSGNPVLIGARYYAQNYPSLSSGQRGNLSLDQKGNLRTILVAPDGNGTAAFNTSQGDATSNSLGGYFTQGFGYVFNASNQWDRVRGVAVGDAYSGLGLPAMGGYVFNGSTFDRQRGDTTSGAYVNVKASAQLDTANDHLSSIRASLNDLAFQSILDAEGTLFT